MQVALKEIVDIRVKRLRKELLVDQVLPQDAAAHYAQLLAEALREFLILVTGEMLFL
jgi:hypothetical protein